jgi:hypothetical protein
MKNITMHVFVRMPSGGRKGIISTNAGGPGYT